MAVAPWSWTASNGSATAAQTVAAYNALVNKDMTSGFSYKVWNDLVSKVNEVNRALSRSWKTDYATYAGTRTSRIYDELTEERFNSLRFNTNYPWWKWAFDPASEGYIGRTDVRGVAGYGDSGADIVYGVYLLELAENLNRVISVINGTAEVEEVRAWLPLLLQPDVELTVPGTAGLGRLRHREILTPSALLRSENLPTLTLHFVIPTAGFRAMLESENISSMLEGFAYISVRTGGRLERLPPVTLSQIVRARSECSALLRQLVPAVFAASASIVPGNSGTLTGLRTAAITASGVNRLLSAADAVSKPVSSIGWHHIRISLEPDAGLVQEIKKMLESAAQLKILHSASFARVSSLPGFRHEGAAGAVETAAAFTPGVPHYMTLSHEVSTVNWSAEMRTVQFLEGLNAEAVLTGPASRAKLEYDHVSTMLRAYMSSVVSGQAVIDKQITGPMSVPVDISVAVPAEAVSDYAPKLVWALETALEIRSEAHTGKAGHGEYHERISVTPSGSAHTGYAAVFDTVRHDYRLSLLGTLTRESRSINTVAHGRYGHSVNGSVLTDPAEPLSCAYPVQLPSANGLLDLEIIEAAAAEAAHSHGFSALAGTITDISALHADSAFSVAHAGGLEVIMYADLSAMLRAVLLTYADIESEGGEWQYPAVIDTDASIFQVWLTERNRSHLFLDPETALAPVHAVHSTNAAIDRQIYAPLSREENYRILPSAALNCIDRAAWEYPVKEGGSLYISQALGAARTRQYTLEVI